MAELFTLWIADEKWNCVREFTGLTLATAEREAAEWVEAYQERGWTLVSGEGPDPVLWQRDGASRRERTVIVVREGVTLGEAFPELVSWDDLDADSPLWDARRDAAIERSATVSTEGMF